MPLIVRLFAWLAVVYSVVYLPPCFFLLSRACSLFCFFFTFVCAFWVSFCVSSCGLVSSASCQSDSGLPSIDSVIRVLICYCCYYCATISTYCCYCHSNSITLLLSLKVSVSVRYDAGPPHGVGDYVGYATENGVPHGQVRLVTINTTNYYLVPGTTINTTNTITTAVGYDITRAPLRGRLTPHASLAQEYN